MTHPHSDFPPSNDPHRSTDPPGDDAPKGAFRSTTLEQAIGTYLPTTILIRLLNFGRILLLTWLMTRKQFGLLTLVLLVVNVLTPLSSLGLNDAVKRYVPQYEQRGSLAAFLRHAFGWVVGVTVISAGLILLFSPALGSLFFAQGLQVPPTGFHPDADVLSLARLSAGIVTLLVIYFYLSAVMKGLRMFSALARLELTHSILFLVGSLAAMALDTLSAKSMAIIYGLSLLAPIATFGPRLMQVMGRWRRQSHSLTETGIGRKLLKFSIWTTLGGVAWQVLLYYPAWFLNKIHGNESVAIFNAVRQIGQFVQIAAVTVAAVVMTTVTKTWESKDPSIAQRQLSLAFRGTCFALFLLCTVIALFSNFIIRIFNASYHDGANILPLLLIFFMLAANLSFLPGHFHLREKTQYIVWPWVVGVTANVLLAGWLAGPYPPAFFASGFWRIAGPTASAVFRTGFWDSQGLAPAAWCGILAISLALITCLVLVRYVGGKLGRGSYFLMAAEWLLACKAWILAPAAVILLLIALRTDWLFTALERSQLRARTIASLRNIPHLKKVFP